MSGADAAKALAAVTDSLVCERDVQETLARLVTSCRAVLGARAVGVMVLAESGELDLLASSSHAAAELELFQIQVDEGPCVDAARRGFPVGVEEVDFERHWPVVGPHITDAGCRAAHAFPLRWQGRLLGGLNVFWDDAPDGDTGPALGQVFADFVTLLLMRTMGDDERETARRLVAAVEGRSVIEQAKGVLAHRHDLDMPAAFERLVKDAEDQRLPLSQAARAVVQQAQTNGGG